MEDRGIGETDGAKVDFDWTLSSGLTRTHLNFGNLNTDLRRLTLKYQVLPHRSPSSATRQRWNTLSENIARSSLAMQVLVDETAYARDNELPLRIEDEEDMNVNVNDLNTRIAKIEGSLTTIKVLVIVLFPVVIAFGIYSMRLGELHI